MSNPTTDTVDLWAFIAGAIGFLSDVAHGGTRFILTVDGMELGAVVPMSDLLKLQQAEVNAKEHTDG